MRKKIVAGNWKMNKNLEEGAELIKKIIEEEESLGLSAGKSVICIPPFVHLDSVNKLLLNSEVQLGAQNVHHEVSGAYTGEVAASMLQSVGVDFCLVGHSERRTYQKESNDQLFQKVSLLIEQEITPIFCVGESLENREEGKAFKVVGSQLEVLFALSAAEFKRLIIAYEPVWAIGTGKTASAEQAQEMHSFIRGEIKKTYGVEVASGLSILYGGSCNPQNAEALFSEEDVDGGLIGGASLDSNSFVAVAKAL